jgi:histidyl-tRNA synthetase
MRDFLPDEIRKRRHTISVIRRVYESYGFEPLETPALENLDVLLGKYGEEGDQLLFKVLRRGQKLQSALSDKGAEASEIDLADMGLRYDLTVPLARVVAAYRGKLPRLLKRYQIQPVWRADRPAKGRFREFYQCDVDVVGSKSPAVEAELLGAACQALKNLGFDRFEVKLNHRELLFGLIEVAGVSSEIAMDAVTAIDKLDKAGEEGVRAELTEKGVDRNAAQRLVEMLRVTPGEGAETVLGRLRSVTSGNEHADGGIDEVENILSLCEAGPAAGRVVADPSLARGLSYYTGAIFEIVAPDLGVSLAGGGRYDDLIGAFSGRRAPACGISLGLERLLVIMEKRGLFPEMLEGPQVVVTCWSHDLLGQSLRIAHELRAAGLKVDVFPEPGKLGKQLKYAEKRKSPLAVIQGPDEAAAGQVSIKDWRAGDQITCPTTEVSSKAKELLSS